MKKTYGSYPKFQVDESEYRDMCAMYWNSCIMEIEHQRKALKLDERGMFLDVAYEDFCAAPGTEFGRIAAFMGVDPVRFGFDLGSVKSTNYKARDVAIKDGWDNARGLMQPAMELKGYSS